MHVSSSSYYMLIRQQTQCTSLTVLTDPAPMPPPHTLTQPCRETETESLLDAILHNAPPVSCVGLCLCLSLSVSVCLCRPLRIFDITAVPVQISVGGIELYGSLQPQL
jgi:hypothetical protein